MYTHMYIYIYYYWVLNTRYSILGIDGIKSPKYLRIRVIINA